MPSTRTPARKPAVFTIDRPAQLDALASPTRQVVLDALTGAGRPCTVARIAELVGRPADSLYYHLRALARAGLIREVDAPGDGPRGVVHYELPGRKARIAYDFASPSFRKRIVRMVSAMLRATDRDFCKAAEQPHARGAGTLRNTWAGRVELRLTREQLGEANRLIRELFALQQAGSSSAGSERYVLTVALAPLPGRRRTNGR